jgi:sphingomyelin phosphodiesterase
LTDPDNVPQINGDPHPLPPTASSARLFDQALAQIKAIIANPIFGINTCAQCHALLEVFKFISLAAPEQGPDLLVAHCNLTNLSPTCEATFGRRNLGAVITQVLANADVGGYDGQVGNQSTVQSFGFCIASRSFAKISSACAPSLLRLPWI